MRLSKAQQYFFPITDRYKFGLISNADTIFNLRMKEWEFPFVWSPLLNFKGDYDPVILKYKVLFHSASSF